MIFENVNLEIHTEHKLGLIGRNGRGKTTLLSLLMGKYEYGGKIEHDVKFDCFPYEIEDKTCLCSDIFGDEWQLLRELSLLKVSPEVLYREFCTLSQGEQTKVMLASLFTRDNNFLLIDEPTNHLDAEGRKILSRYLKSKSGFILVSHDREVLDEVIDHVLSINRANIKTESGNFSTWYENKLREDNYELSQNEKIKKEVKRLSETATEKSQWSDKVEKTKYGTKNSGLRPDRGYIGHKSAKMMKRAKSIEKRAAEQLEERESLLKNLEKVDDLKITPLTFHSNVLIEAKNLSLAYGENTVFTGLGFCIKRGSKISLQGKNGCGKSSLIKLILGENLEHSGELYVPKSLVISYVSQHTDDLSGWLCDFEKEHGLDVVLFRAILRKLDFKRGLFDNRLETYSAGQKKKVLIAKSLSQRAHLYIWDEPLNYIDVLSRIQIENLIKSSEMTLLFVEHDKVFCDNIASETMKL